MAQYVAPEIENLRENPRPNQFVEVVLVVDEGEVSNICNRAEEHSGEVIENLGSGVLIVELPETQLSDFCDTDLLKSVSEPNRMQVLS